MSSSAQGTVGTCEGFVCALPIQHAAMCTLGRPFDVETVCASDPLAARLDEVQLDLGEGPCWSARQTHAPVVIHDVRAGSVEQWPMFRAAIATYAVRSVYAFPLAVGPLDVGAVVLYGSEPEALTTEGLAHALLLAEIAAGLVLEGALAQADERMGEGPFSRRVVHQATGMVIAQMRVTAEDALLLIRAHAFTADRPVREIAGDITARRLDFTA